MEYNWKLNYIFCHSFVTYEIISRDVISLLLSTAWMQKNVSYLRSLTWKWKTAITIFYKDNNNNNNGYETSHVTFDRFSAVLLYNFLIQSLGSILSIVISITVALLLHCLIFSLCSYPFFCIVFSELSPSFFYLLFIVIIIFPVIFLRTYIWYQDFCWWYFFIFGC